MKLKLLILAAVIGCVSINARSEISSVFDGGAGWINHYDDRAAFDAELGNGGFAYGIPDLISITSDSITYQMLPNTLLYSDAIDSGNVTNIAYWTDSVDGGITPGNNGGQYIDALNYRSGSPLVGTTNLVFNFNVDANSLDTNYEARAFIKILNPADGWATYAYTNVVISNTGPYTLVKEVITGDDAYVFQAGYQLLGLNANATNTSPTYASHGSTTVTIQDIIFEDDDFIAPNPDPMTWASVPSAFSAIAIEMTATTAVDTNGTTDVVDHGVEYLFTNVTAGYDSGWQSSPYWLDDGVSTPATTNSVDVITNPAFSPVDTDWNGFEGAPVFAAVSPTGFVTSAAGVATVTPASANEYNYFQEFPAGELQGATTFSIDGANITVDGTATVFVKEFDAGFGWIGFAGQSTLVAGANSISFTANPANAYQVGVYTIGTTTGSYDLSNPVLTTDVVTPGTPGGLTPLTSYDYQVKARDKSSQLNETGWSVVEGATTAAPETNPPTPDPMTFADLGDASPVSILLNASVATDDTTTVEYLFVNTSNAVSSGWVTDTQYLETGLTPGTTYGYTVTARDLNGNVTAPSTELVIATLAEPASGALSDSLTGYTGNTDDPIVVHNLAKLGLETGSTNPDANIVFTSTGAVFSAGIGFTGRDVLRTVAAGYETVGFTAYATITIDPVQTDQSGYIGIGQGVITGLSGSNWGVPELALTGVNGVVGELKTLSAGGDKLCKLMKTVDGDPGVASGGESITSPPVAAGETVRAQLVYNAVSNTIRIAIHNSYTGGPFVESQLLGQVDGIVSTTGVSMWTNAPVRVYFGGGEGTRITDIEIIPEVVAPPVQVTDLVILSAGGGTAVLQWTGVAGQKYDVYYKNNLVTDPSWTLDPAPANQNISGVTGSMATSATIAGDEVFYQISTDHE